MSNFWIEVFWKDNLAGFRKKTYFYEEKAVLLTTTLIHCKPG